MFKKVLMCTVGIFSLCLATMGEAKQEDVGKGSKGPGKVAAAPQADTQKSAPDRGPADSNAATSSGTAGGGYAVQLKHLEQRVNELKERIFRSKARLNLLKETVLHGVIAGSRTVILHKNEMGSSFRLIKLTYSVDGTKIFSKFDDTGLLDDKREFEVFNGSIVPGDHTVSVQMVFRGHGYGVFSYLKAYKFRVQSSHTFTAGEGRQNIVTVRAYEKGNITTEMRDRPAIKFDVKLFAGGAGSPSDGKESGGGEK